MTDTSSSQHTSPNTSDASEAGREGFLLLIWRVDERPTEASSLQGGRAVPSSSRLGELVPSSSSPRPFQRRVARGPATRPATQANGGLTRRTGFRRGARGEGRESRRGGRVRLGGRKGKRRKWPCVLAEIEAGAPERPIYVRCIHVHLLSRLLRSSARSCSLPV